jgi:Protein of unknown function (DUF998)
MQAVTSTDDTATKKAMMARSRTAARLSVGASTLFLVLLVALHVIKPEVDPSWQMISEYAIGRYGWIMTLAFLALTVSYVALFIAIRSQLRTIVGRIGLALLLVSAVGLAIGGIFTTDPFHRKPGCHDPERPSSWLGLPAWRPNLSDRRDTYKLGSYPQSGVVLGTAITCVDGLPRLAEHPGVRRVYGHDV